MSHSAKDVFVTEEFVSKCEAGVEGESGAETQECGASLQSLCYVLTMKKKKKTKIGIYHEIYLVRLLLYCTYSRAVGLLWAFLYLISNLLLSHIASLSS